MTVFVLKDFIRTKLLEPKHQLTTSNKTIVINRSMLQKQAPQLSITSETVITTKTVITVLLFELHCLVECFLVLVPSKSSAFWFFCSWPFKIFRVIAAELIGNCRNKTFKAVRNSTKYGQNLHQILLSQLSSICLVNYL